MSLPKVSVIVTTYNWPKALNRVLSGLARQTTQQFEVIVADDGSSIETAETVRKWKAQSPVPVVHCWHPDEGFRAAMIRNRAVAQARNEYLIFLDGDCVPVSHFVSRHMHLAQKGWFVSGNRVLLGQKFTEQVLSENIDIESWPLKKWGWATLLRKCNGFGTLIQIPLGNLRKITPLKWQGVKTCNLGIWHEDFREVNGFDENYAGWGFEDSDLVIRLQRAKIFNKVGKYGIGVLHLWHPLQDRSLAQNNALRLQETLKSSKIKAQKGIDQYIDDNNY